MYVCLSRPNELSQIEIEEFDRDVLLELHERVEILIGNLHGYEDQPHVEPQLRVSKPGTYLDMGEAIGNRETHVDRYRLHFSFGSYRVDLDFANASQTADITRDAVSSLLEEAESQIVNENESSRSLVEA